jgi:N-methylhydantoinase A/oxoprolinase/acetone carboxylase beta subunit
MKRSLRIGVDVGGTNTDAVILDTDAIDTPNRGIIAFCKTTTTSPNVTDGIESAVRNVLEQSGIPHSEVACLVIGTTHFINAIVEHDVRRLSKVAIIRLSKSFTKEIPPFSDFPSSLKKIINGYYGYVDGGLHIDGLQEAPIVEEQVVEQCKTIGSLGLMSIVISGVFSPIDKHFRQEERVMRIIQRELLGADIVCSSDVSNIGFLERENAAILNASILGFARRTVRGFKAVMKRLDLKCALFLSQNDGTLIDADTAARLPIRTFSSGPTNSMRGAAYLGLAQSGRETESRTTTIVIDVGGTTTDVGVLLPSGFPRQASAYVTVAGVRINFAMPHIESIGLGGGSIVRETSKGITVGPDSVGHHLNPEARVFGGAILTATDIAVAAGEKIGDPKLVQDIDEATINTTQARIKRMLEGLVDIMKMSPDPLPVLLVGGGSVICPTNLQGISKLIIPPFHSVANAVGAAISKVGASIDIIQNTATMSPSEAIDQAKATAIKEAIEAGAKKETITIAEVEAMPLQYVADQLRVIVRATGELSAETMEGGQVGDDEVEESQLEDIAKVMYLPLEESVTADVTEYRPRVVKNEHTGVPEWHVSETDVEWMRDGCYVLGCAGGGSPSGPYIRLRDELRAGHTVRVIDASGLSEDALIYCK